MLSGIIYLVRACFEVFYPRTMTLSSSTVQLWSRVLCRRPRSLCMPQSPRCVMGSQTVVPREIPSEADVSEAGHEVQPLKTGTESERVDYEVPVFPHGDAQSIDSEIDHEVPVVEIGKHESDTKEVNHEKNVVENGDILKEEKETDSEGHVAESGDTKTEKNETGNEKHVAENGDIMKEENGTDDERHMVETGDTEMGNNNDSGRHIAQIGDAEIAQNEMDHERHVVMPTAGLTNAEVVEWVITYSKLQDEALGDRLIFQLAPEKYRNQGLKPVYDRLRWQVNPHRHPLGGQHRALAFKAFEYLHVAYRRLEKNA